MKKILLIVFIAMIVSGSTSQAQQKDSTLKEYRMAAYTKCYFDITTPLGNRIRKTPDKVLDQFHEAGMSPKEHTLTEAESKAVAKAFELLPPLHKEILRDRLLSISFLDDMPNTALTSAVNFEDRYNLYHITFRAAILQQTVSEWLTWKERTCFDTTNSSLRVSVEGGSLNALVYVLLHETSHVVDAALGLTVRLPGKLLDREVTSHFTDSIWKDRTTVYSNYLQPALQGIVFRRDGKPIPVSEATNVYNALQKTPFVSLYGSSARSEDFAEYVSVYHFMHDLHQPIRVIIKDKQKEVFAYESMQSKLVMSRAKEMERFFVKTTSFHPIN